MIKIIRHVQTYAPEYLGVRDLVIVGDKIEGIYNEVKIADSFLTTEVIDGTGKMAFPGFIDTHVHITGGGGEGGFKTRTPELMLSDAVKGGVTCVVGCLGTDGVCRSMPALVAKARGLEEEGITAYCYTGSYEIPVVTITGSVRSDVMLIDKVVGAGEIALADHRSSQSTKEELANVIAQARVGGMLAGKAGVTNIHLGEGVRGFCILNEIFSETELPITQVLPTHVNRSYEITTLGIEFAKKGGYIDFTTSGSDTKKEKGLTAAQSLQRCLQEGVDPGHITFSSDGQGSLPMFDSNRQYIGLGIGSVQSLYGQVREAVLELGVPLEQALRTITSNPADVFKFSTKGRLCPGVDADVVLVDQGDMAITDVLAKGRMLMRNKELLVRGTFER